MNRILAILQKDVRALWPYVLLLWLMMLLTAAFDPLPIERPVFLSRDWLLHQLHFGEAVACWLVVAVVMQQERASGGNQYWLSRPIAWLEVLAAKALFVVALVDLPRLICRYSFGAPTDELRLAVFVILPCAALAAVTRNLGEAALAGLGTYFAVAILPEMMPSWGPHLPGWQSELLIGVAAVVVLLLQYSRRGEWLARSLVAAGIIGAIATLKT